MLICGMDYAVLGYGQAVGFRNARDFFGKIIKLQSVKECAPWS
jgi:hypothetical protein